jgi:hypothetical protein
MSPLPIEPAAYDFGAMLKVGTLEVPRYQRAYDWGKEEVRDFARDVEALASSRLRGTPAKHFFGAVITIHGQGSTFEIIDGQQRITTHMLCLKELRDRWLALSEAAGTRRKAIGDYAVARADEVEKVIFAGEDERLVLSRRDREFFADLINDIRSEAPDRSDPESHHLLWGARQKLREELFDSLRTRSGRLDKRQERLQALQDALLEDGYVVHLNSKESDQAYRLFMVINDRGKELSAGDLLRTHTLAELEKYRLLQEAAEKDWNAILSANEEFVNRFLAAYYSSHTGERVPTGEMFDRFRKQFLNKKVNSPSSARALRERILQIKTEFETFQQITRGQWPYPNGSKKEWEQDRLKRLVKTLSHRLADPLLLATARKEKEAGFWELVRMLELFAFRYIIIVQGTPGRLESVYFEHARKTHLQGLDKNGLRNRLKGMLNSYAGDDVFATQLEERLQFNRSGAKSLIKHFLATLEDFEDWYQEGARGKPKPRDRAKVFSLKAVNIEHIYPQNPSRQDRSLNPLKHTLGNLTALDETEGVKAGNKPFSKKKPTYAASRFKITQPLAEVEDWNPTEVAERVDFYVKRALKMFVVG